jgi:hypothetical protein
MKNETKLIMNITKFNLTQCIQQYEENVDDLPRIHKELGGGQARNASGLIYENLIKNTCESIGLTPKKNDYKKTEEVEGTCLKNLQVDWHVYKGETLKYLIESKTYLDACYLKRAVMDFIELENSPEVPDDVEYAIFAGQSCVGKDAFAYYQAFFTKLTGKKISIFFVNPQKRRTGKRPIYSEDCREDFVLDHEVFNNFVQWML